MRPTAFVSESTTTWKMFNIAVEEGGEKQEPGFLSFLL